MGKKSRKEKNAESNPLLSTPVKPGDEFEGLQSFEELSSCTFMRLNKYGRIKREVWKDGKIFKMQNGVQTTTEVKRLLPVEQKFEFEIVSKKAKKKKKKKKGKQNVSVETEEKDLSAEQKSKTVSKKAKKKKKKGKQNVSVETEEKDLPAEQKSKTEELEKVDKTPEEVETEDETPSVSKNKSKKRKKTKLTDTSVPVPSKKPRYDNAHFHGSSQDSTVKVDVSEWESIFTPPEVLEALSELGFSSPTEIQRLVLPAAIKGRMDIIGAAETGSGKTLAFGIPIIHGILHDRKREAEQEMNSEDSGVENSDEEAIENGDEDGIESSDEGGIANGDEEGIENSDEEILENSDEEAMEEEDSASEEENQLTEEDLQNAQEIGVTAFSNSDEEDFSGEESDREFDDESKVFQGEFGCVKVIDNADFDFLDEKKHKTVMSTVKPLRALIVTPTRELAIQVKSHLASVLVHTDIQMAVVIGGLASEKQERMLSKGPEIVIGTPGRLWELLDQGNEHLLKIDNVSYLAIDETDRMVEQGHFEELKQLLERINSNEEAMAKRQNFVFSATLTLVHSAPKRIKAKGKAIQMTSEIKVKQLAKIVGLKDKPKVVDVTRKFGTAESLTESRINCDKEEKDFYLYYFLKQYPGRTLVFCNSIDCVRRLQNLFTLLQCQPLSLHAQMHQKQRLKSLERFSTSRVSLMLATDVAARGLDIPNIQHVLHYQTPRTAETYIHRSGRTARAMQEGLSVLFVDATEMTKYRQLCKTLNRDSDLPPFPVNVSVMNQVQKRLNFARKLETMEHTHRKSRAEENWFKKAAQEAELLIEEDSDEDVIRDKDMKAAQQKRENRTMRAKLAKMLSLPLISSNFSGKYPTQSGALVTPYVRGRLINETGDNTNALSVMKKESVEFSKLVKKIKPVAPRQKKTNTKKKFKGFEKRKLKLQKAKEKRDKEANNDD